MGGMNIGSWPKGLARDCDERDGVTLSNDYFFRIKAVLAKFNNMLLVEGRTQEGEKLAW